MIKGLAQIKRLPRLGMIRIGVKQEKIKDGRRIEYPQAVDHFVVPPEVAEVHGERPTSLGVLLPSNDVELNFPVWLKRYGKTKGLICKGDGEIATCVDQQTGEIAEIECPYRECPFYQKGECKEVGVLNFLLPEVEGIGVWQIATSSINSIHNLTGEMALTKRLLGGRLAGIPMSLVVEPIEVVPKGMTTKKTVYVLHLRSTLKLGDLRALTPFQSAGPLALPSGDDCPEELYPALMDGADEAEGNGMDNSRPSETEDQRDFWITARQAGLTEAGGRRVLEELTGRTSTKELTHEEALAVAAFLEGLSEEDISAYNAETAEVVEGEVVKDEVLDRITLEKAIADLFESAGLNKARQVLFVHGVTAKGQLNQCTDEEVRAVYDNLLAQKEGAK